MKDLMMNYYYFFFIALILLFFDNKISFSQDDCPIGVTFVNDHVNYTFGMLGSGGEVEFGASVGDEIIIKMDWSSFINSSDFCPNSALKKILESEAVKASVPEVNEHRVYNAYVYYKTECYVYSKFVIELDQTTQIACCSEGYDIPEIYKKFENGEFHYYINEIKKVACGNKCCRRVYRCERIQSSGEWITVVSQPTTESVSNCSTSNCVDCMEGIPLPCVDESCDDVGFE